MLRHEASRFLIKAIVKGDQREVRPVRIKLWKNLGSGREEALNGDTSEREKGRGIKRRSERKKEKKRISYSFNESADRVSDKICELKFLPRFKGNFVIRDGESLLKGIGSVIRSWAGGWWPVVFLKDDRANLGAARFHCLESNWITV